MSAIAIPSFIGYVGFVIALLWGLERFLRTDEEVPEP